MPLKYVSDIVTMEETFTVEEYIYTHTAASELTLQSDCLELVSGSPLKPSRFCSITKIPVAFES